MAAYRKKAKSGEAAELESMVQRGPEGAYEALQLFRSRALRFKTKGDIKSAINTACSGAKALLKGSYTHAGSELSALMIKLLEEAGEDLDVEARAMLDDVDSAYEQGDKDPSSSVQRTDFLKSCIKWSQSSGTRELGDPELHIRLGHCLWGGEEGKRDIKQAIYHFVAGEAPVPINEKICATFRSDQAKREQNLVIALLHFLAMENLRDANELFLQFKKEQKARNASTDSPLLVFLSQLLEVCRRDAVPLFKTLVNANIKSLEFDEICGQLLSGPIGQKFFNIKPSVNPMMQMMQQLLS